MSMVTVAIVVLVVAALYGLHRLALFAESRGWVYYRTRPSRVRARRAGTGNVSGYGDTG